MQIAIGSRSWIRYVIALALVLAGLLSNFVLISIFGQDLPEYITFYPAVMLAGLVGGLGPGLMATVFAGALVDYYIVSPKAAFFQGTPAESAGLILFLFLGAFMSGVTELYRRARDTSVAFQKELALKESQEQHRLALEAGNLGTWDYDRVTGTVSWDERCKRLFGLTQEHHLDYRKVIDLIYETDRDRVDQAVRAAVAGAAEGRYQLEYRVRWPNGSLRWVAALGQVHFDEKGSKRIAKRFVGTVQDITQRKRIEGELLEAHAHLERKVQERTSRLQRIVMRLREEIRIRRRAETRIKQTELRYRTVAEFTHDWEYWRAPDGSFLYCSPSCLRITGCTAEEFTSNPTLVEALITAEDIPAWETHEREAKSKPGERTLQFQIRRKDGELRWIEHACKSVVGPSGELLGVRASNRDVTDRRLTEMETQRLRGELSRVSRITVAGQLTAAIAHELNQPLGATLCNVQSAEKLLSLQKPDLEEARSALADIAEDTRRASAVIRRLRSLYQNSGQNRSPLNLNDVIQETLTLVRSELVLKKVELHLNLDPVLPQVLGNATELQQVVLNLVLNAIESMNSCEPGSRHLRVSTRTEAELACCSISDSGPGIPKEALERILEPFFTTKATGMGMGLAISNSIVQAHDGRLWAENSAAGGATFHFSLPQPEGV